MNRSPGDPPQADPDATSDRRNPIARIAVRAGLVVLGSWLLAAIVVAALGARAASSGADRVQAFDLELDVSALLDGELDDEVDAARQDFAMSDRFLSSPVLGPVRLLPVVGRQLRSAGALAAATTEVLEASTSALDALRAEVGDGAPTGAERVDSLGRLRDELDAVRAVVNSVDLGPSEALIGPLHDARVEVADRLQEASSRMDDVLVVVDAMHSLLEGPARYLVLAANNAEMRVGSAMVLSVGTVEVEDGRVDVVEEFEPAGDLLLPERVELPEELATLWGWSDIGSDFRSLALSARFPPNAELAADMWNALGRGDVDGVLLIDAEGLASLLRVAGPVDVDGELIGDQEVVPFLLRGQYGEQSRNDLEANDERRDRLRVLAAAALRGLSGADVDLRSMLDELRGARDGRHLLLWSPDPQVQAAWEMMDVDGDLGPRTLLLGLANFDNSKLDPYVQVSATARARRDGTDAVIDVAVEVTYDAPEDLPGYVAGADGGASYRGLVVAHMPSGVTDVELEGFDGRAASGRDGSTFVVAARADVPRNGHRSGNLRFRLPKAELAEVVILPSARIPPTRWILDEREHWDHSALSWPRHVP